MQGHRSVGMRPIYLAADAHRLVALTAEQLILGLGVVLAVAEVENRFL